jgi:hypothetical protein
LGLRFDLRAASVVFAISLAAPQSAHSTVLDAVELEFSPHRQVARGTLIQLSQTSPAVPHVENNEKEHASEFCHEQAKFTDLEKSMFADMGRLRGAGRSLSKVIDALSPLSKSSYLKLFEMLSPGTIHPNYKIALMKFRYDSLSRGARGDNSKSDKSSPAFIAAEDRRMWEMRILCEEIRKLDE